MSRGNCVSRCEGSQFFADVDVHGDVAEGGMVLVDDLSMGLAHLLHTALLREREELLRDSGHAGSLLFFIQQVLYECARIAGPHLSQFLLQSFYLPVLVLQQSFQISNLAGKFLVLLFEQPDHGGCLFERLVLQFILLQQLLDSAFAAAFSDELLG